MIISVKVHPNSGRKEIMEKGGVIHAYLKSAAEAGKANRELVSLLAEKYGIHESDVKIAGGFSSRTKMIEIKGKS
ncbi:MAG: DUF167 domain-containing protein [Candidatus Aenigmarchaeota archaeon]|nr:DUF167 domain-containing protein [Candidatus Aenigmarchaeota archaeon]